MFTRALEKVVDSKYVMMGKFKIAQSLPVDGIKQVDPFLLLHHAGPTYQPPNNSGLNVEAHPHTGFQPVTFVFNGEVEHRDSLGNNSIIRSGGVQWISAGKGIVHSEKASPDFIKNGGDFEIIQLWINLPKNLKKSMPTYFGFEEGDIPFHLSGNKKARLNIIAGHYNQITGPAVSKTGITAYTGILDKEGTLNLDFDQSQNVIIYVLNGQVIINDREISDKQLVVFKQDGTNIKIKANTITKLLVLAGEPIKESVFHYGPFVLNSKDEVIDANDDFESGRMGILD